MPKKRTEKTLRRRLPRPIRTSPPSDDVRLGILAFADVFLVIVLALSTMFYRLTASSLWADEGNSVAQAMRPLPQLIQHAALDIHPPLYYILLHGWVRVFGTSEFALRSLSAFAGVGVVFLTWLVAKYLWGRTTAFVAGLLAACHPFLVYYAQEVRMYIFLALWSTLAAYLLVRIILQEGRARLYTLKTNTPLSPHHPALTLGKWDVGFIVALAAGLWTHYTFPVVIGTFLLAYLIWIISTRRSIPVVPRLIRAGTHYIGALVLYTPWLPVALERLQHWPRPQTPLPINTALAYVWHWLTIGPTNSPTLERWLWLWGALLIVALWPWRRRTRTGYRRPHWLSWGLPVLWVTLPIGVMAAGHLFKPAYLKFLIVGVPPFVILLARGTLAPWEGRPQHSRAWRQTITAVWFIISAVSILILESVGLAYYYTHPQNVRDDYRGIAQYIKAVAEADDAIILDAPGQWDVFHYYYQGPLPVYLLPENRPPLRSRVEQRLQEIASKHNKLFVLLWATNESDPENLVEHWLDAHAYKALDVWRGNVRFLIYALPATSEEDAWVKDVDIVLGDHIHLRHIALWNWEVPPGNVVQVRLRWETQAPVTTRYKVFLQLLGPGDRLIAQRDTEPVGGDRPTSTWTVGETIVDNYGLLIPLATPPGTYRLIGGMYDPQTGQRIPVHQGEKVQDHIEFPLHIIVQRPQHPPPETVLPIQHRIHERWGPIRLLGYNRYKRGYRHAPSTPIHSGDFLHITCFWEAIAPPKERWRVTLSLVDGWGNVVATLTDDLVGPIYPTTRWQAGEILRGEFDLYIPQNTKPGPYGLQIQLWRNDHPVREPVPLGAVRVEASSQ